MMTRFSRFCFVFLTAAALSGCATSNTEPSVEVAIAQAERDADKAAKIAQEIAQRIEEKSKVVAGGTERAEKSAPVTPESNRTRRTIEDEQEIFTEPQPYIGKTRIIRAKHEDTLLDLMREYNLGYVEIRAANPGMDVWLPGEGTEITLPTMHLIPDAPREGLVINLADMRMYSFVGDANNPKSFPIGVGREGLSTPMGKTTITHKKDGPTWRPTPRMRKEDPKLPAEVPPGEDNPLGTHAMYLGWPSYLIHGTNKPYSLGRRASSGCIRMYPEDIIKAFDQFPVGTKINVIRQPLKMAWIDGTLYLEAHAEETLADNIEREGLPLEYDVPENLFAQLRKKLGAQYQYLDWDQIRTILKERRGYPIAILSLEEIKRVEQQKEEDALKKAEEELRDASEADKTAKADAEAAEDDAEPVRSTVSKRGFN